VIREVSVIVVLYVACHMLSVILLSLILSLKKGSEGMWNFFALPMSQQACIIRKMSKKDITFLLLVLLVHSTNEP
jgi:hypothetical protein